MELPPLILASASPRRVELLRRLKLRFEVQPANVAEVHSDQLTAREACQVNAYRKARAVAKRRPDALVLAADTLVHLDNRLFGKPADLAEAHRMLARLSGRTHEVVTGVCLMRLRRHECHTFVEGTDVTFRKLAAKEITRYLAAINPLDKAGAYAIQDFGDWIVQEVDGSFTNVVGLPIERLQSELRDWPA
jgi:septum formation protein